MVTVREEIVVPLPRVVRRRKGDETCGTETMFDVAPLAAMRDENSRTKPAKAKKYGLCPTCNRRGRRNEKLNTGLIRMGAHLVWKPHNIVTWKGTRLPCRSSGVAVCAAPDREKLVDCTCEDAA